VSPGEAQKPAYISVLAPLAGFGLLIWWMLVR
jgi:hypothetical protein